MSDAQAGTPATTPENSNAGQGSGAADGSGLNAQQQKEFMTLKQKAEDFNKVKAERDTLEQRIVQMEQAIYSRGAGQATDPTADLVNQLREQAQYDPVARGTLLNMEMTVKAQAESWLANELVSVSAVKRDRVAGIIRNSGYQIGAAKAEEMVTDPETKSLADKLQEAENEIARLKNAKANGSSPASAVPSTASADDDGSAKEMKRSEYLSVLKQGGQRAHDLMKAVGENRTKLVQD